ncbi:hypothetical protein C8F01DRAFT_1099728 [Mycena amicta]|nr:hypothetical protein C8F01DRAFT_1099728 [Mycena amicta]
MTPAEKQAIGEILDAINNATGHRKRRLASEFLELVDRSDWPQYYRLIPQPRALDPIRVNLDKNKYKRPLDAYTDISLVFWNATYYNEPDSQIAGDAQTLKNLLENEWKARDLPTPPTSPPPQSAQKMYGGEPPEFQSEEETSLPVNPPIHAPKPAIAAQPTLIIEPSISTLGPNAVTPVSPITLSLYPESESEEEGDIPEPPPGAPSDLQIVRHLERGLKGFSSDQGAEGGWMEDVKHERHLEIVQAIKSYKDAAGTKLSATLDPQIPEEKLGVTFKLLDSRSRSKTFYTSSRQFDIDLARLFENGRRYYLERGDHIAGVGGEDWANVVALQRVANELTSAQSPSLPLLEPLSYRIPLAAPGTNSVDSVVYKGFTIRPGDHVHLISGAADGDSQMGFGRGRPLVCRVTACWHDDTGEAGVTVRWYLRVDEVSHLISARRKRGGIFEGEVVQTEKKTHHHLVDVLERVACQHSSSASRGRPRAPAWYPGWPLYVCGFRYDAGIGRVRHIKRAEWFSADGGGAEDKEVLDLFERPVRFATWPKKNSYPADRSVVSAGGVAVTGIERLPPETARHFERDPTTGEVLWFPGPPLHLARAPGPRHTLQYLEFLANRYNPKLPTPETLSNGNGSVGASEEDATDDVKMEPPPKRQKVETYLSASELIRQAFAAENENA